MKTNEPSVGRVTQVKHAPLVKRNDLAKAQNEKRGQSKKDGCKNKKTGKFIDEIV